MGTAGEEGPGWRTQEAGAVSEGAVALPGTLWDWGVSLGGAASRKAIGAVHAWESVSHFRPATYCLFALVFWERSPGNLR